MGSERDPEIILHRHVVDWLRHQDGCSGYLGKLDLRQFERPLESFLQNFQDAMNEALRLESANASGGVDHPPFHFDYLDVRDGTRNAHAFEHGGFAFIVVTWPLVNALGDLSMRLIQSPGLGQLLKYDNKSEDFGKLQGLLFGILMGFLVCHEYTHHVHKHNHDDGKVRVWTEFSSQPPTLALHSQAQEIDADGYGSYIVLEHLLRGALRDNALATLGRNPSSEEDIDQLLLAVFFVATLAFFCERWYERKTDTSSIHNDRHPPPPVRIQYIFRVAHMWCEQNKVSSAWFEPQWSKQLFGVAASVFQSQGKSDWDRLMSFLVSPEGIRYNDELFKEFEVIRKVETPTLRDENPRC
jgi:hypothetical protein